MRTSAPRNDTRTVAAAKAVRTSCPHDAPASGQLVAESSLTGRCAWADGTVRGGESTPRDRNLEDQGPHVRTSLHHEFSHCINIPSLGSAYVVPLPKNAILMGFSVCIGIVYIVTICLTNGAVIGIMPVLTTKKPRRVRKHPPERVHETPMEGDAWTMKGYLGLPRTATPRHQSGRASRTRLRRSLPASGRRRAG